MFTIAPPLARVAHRLRLVLHREHHAGEVGVDHGPPLVDRVIGDEPEGPEPGGVHRGVEATEARAPRAAPCARRRPRSVTSTTSPTTAAPSSAVAASSGSALRSPSTTRAPSRTKRRAHSRPMPDAPPVITATRPSNRPSPTASSPFADSDARSRPVDRDERSRRHPTGRVPREGIRGASGLGSVSTRVRPPPRPRRGPRADRDAGGPPARARARARRERRPPGGAARHRGRVRLAGAARRLRPPRDRRRRPRSRIRGAAPEHAAGVGAHHLRLGAGRGPRRAGSTPRCSSAASVWIVVEAIGRFSDPSGDRRRRRGDRGCARSRGQRRERVARGASERSEPQPARRVPAPRLRRARIASA